MSTEIEEARLVDTDQAWYSKMFDCMKNRNRISPGKVELPDCNFFNVGQRRTLRVLLPKPRSSVYYEQTVNDRPETIDENFVSRWGMRPHPSGNCRCSFRRCYRLGMDEERIINEEINRIRTSLCEAEKTGEDIDDLEQRISVNLDGLHATDLQRSSIKRDSQVVPEDDEIVERDNFASTIDSDRNDDQAIKNKIVKDLEKYIEVLLQEVLNDTMKFFSSDTLIKTTNVLENDKDLSRTNFLNDFESTKIREESILNPENDNFGDGTNSLNIKFAFHDDGDSKKMAVMEVEEFCNGEENGGGYVNRAFAGSKNDPDSLDFDFRKPLDDEIVIDNLDCIDSGINSVETIEFPTSQEPSLEESLMKIIDAKLGRAPIKRSWEDLSDKNETKNNDETISDNVEKIENSKIPATNTEMNVIISNDKMEESLTMIDEKDGKSEIFQIVENKDNNLIEEDPEKSVNDLEDIEDHSNFDKLRLELVENCNDTKKKSTLREKFCWKFGKNRENDEESKNIKIEDVTSNPVELRVKRQNVWTNSESLKRNENENPVEFVKFRRNKKPAIVFIHGFGSSAEIFDHQLEYFSNLGYPCIAPEMLGHGMSSAPDRSRDYHFDKLLKDLEMVLQHYAFRPGRKCVLVAHNYGCSFATALAYKYDSKIHQLVLISGGSPTPLAPPSSEGAAHSCLRAMLTPLLMCGLRRDVLYSARGRQHPYCGSEPPEQWPSHMKYVLNGMVWPEGDYVFHRRISTPTLLVHGLRDNKVSLVQECQMERTIIKAFLDVIPTAGHTPMTDCPDQVNHMIHCFIDLWRRKKR